MLVLVERVEIYIHGRSYRFKHKLNAVKKVCFNPSNIFLNLTKYSSSLTEPNSDRKL